MYEKKMEMIVLTNVLLIIILSFSDEKISIKFTINWCDINIINR